MNLKFVPVAIGPWSLFMFLAIINAVARESIYKSIIGDLRAHQVSTFVFIALIFLVTYLVLRFSDLKLSTQESFIIGTIWLLLTICFEFIAGHYIFGNSWEKLFADYNILKGRIWSLVLITIFFSPYLTNKLI